MNLSITAVLITIVAALASLIGTYFYSHNAGYDEGKSAEQVICQAYKDDQEKSVQNYKDQIQSLANNLDQANLKNQSLSRQLDAANSQELQHETSTPFYDLVIPPDGVRAYNKRIQASKPPNAK